MKDNNLNKIKNYTLALYNEKNGEPMPVGSGILVEYKGQKYLLSAFHVFDREDEQLSIEDNPDEIGIEHDNFDEIYALGIYNEEVWYIVINSNTIGQCFTMKYNKRGLKDNIEPLYLYSEQEEYLVAKLSNPIIEALTKIGKEFYSVNSNNFTTLSKDIKTVLSGYPQVAYKKQDNKWIEQCRLYESILINESYQQSDVLFHMFFDNDHVLNLDTQKYITLPHKGIDGMSGGGIWIEEDENIYLLGIILFQDPKEEYVEAIKLQEILNGIDQSNVSIN